MIFIESKINSIIINEVDFKLTRNYMPELVLALREMNPKKKIHFVIDIDKAPLMFIMYFRKLKEATPTLDLALYFKDQSSLLKQVMKQYNLPYAEIDMYPFDMPKESNIIEVKDPFEKVEGWLPMTSDTDS